MTGRLPFAPHFDHLVYVRLFEGCNLHCDHCFIPSNPKKMSRDDFAAIPRHIASFAKPGSHILLQWHGGEPTIFGPDHLATAIEAVQAADDVGFDWAHGIQTNLMNYGPDWPDLYRRYFDGAVGVSWDPVIRLLRRGAPETHDAYDQKFWANFAALKADGLESYLVVTFTRTLVEAFPNPLSLFMMLRDRGVTRLHFERVTRTGYAREHWDRIGLNNAEYAHYMSRFFRAYQRWQIGCEDPKGVGIHISPFDGLTGSVQDLQQGRLGGYGCWSGKCDTTFHTIDANGYKKGCTAVTSEIDNPRAHESLMFGDLVAARAERQWDCKTCRFRPICSSGCMATMMDDGSGECAGASRLFAVVDLAIEQQVAFYEKLS